MNVKDPKEIRNIGFFGHSGSGKTSLAEATLFTAGGTDRLGKVMDKNTVFDYEAEEQRRQISLTSSFASAGWKKHKVTIADTPGDSNFFADSRSTMQAVDLAILVIDAVDGLKVNSEKVITTAKELNLPLAVVVNKMDKERANFDAVLEHLNAFGSFIPVQLPMGSESSFKGVVDLVTMKAYTYDGKAPKGTSSDIPADLADRAKEAREKLMEAVAETDDELTEKYLEAGELSAEEIKKGLYKGIVSRNIFPVLCAGALPPIGIDLLLDFVVEYGPTPLDHPPIPIIKGEEETTITPSADGPFAALVFKTIVDPYAGQLTVFRIYSGKLEGNQLYNSTRGERERFGNILQLKGSKQETLSQAVCGEICAVAKLKSTKTGDTFCDESDPFTIKSLPVPNGVITFAVKPKAKGDEDKIAAGLNRLAEEDPTLTVGRDPATKDILLTGMGTLHIEVILERLKNKFGVECQLEPPKVPYRETIKGTAQAQGRYKKQTGGRGQFGDCWLEIKPLPRGKGFEFINAIVGGAIPRQYIPAVEKGVKEAMEGGAIAGYPVIDVSVKLYDGSYHSVDSSEIAFKIAASMGFKKAVQQAKPVLLEPIMKMEVIVPEEFMGDVIGDLNSRRGKVLGMDTRPGGMQVIRAEVPMAEVLRYEPDLTSITSGRGAFTMEFSHYAEVPAQIAEKIIAERNAEKEAKEN